ncbi:MAG TPA: NADH:flavin oxidoreductase [Clostridiaceae bacterium]
MTYLNSKLVIKGIEIKNRIVMPPMVCFGYTKADGIITQKTIEHYKERAKGGCGLIIIEAACIMIDARLDISQIGIWSDDHIEGFSKLAKACHEYGTKVIVQIHHAGLKLSKKVEGKVLAPSSYQDKNVKAEEINTQEIKEIQEAFVAAAIRAEKAGLDGVELHGAHGYLISQFFSPIVNKREDEYGGSIENRTRFTTEIVGKIRKSTGSNFIIGCRMGCNEPDLASSIEIAKGLEAAGVDLLHISTGFDSDVIPSLPKDLPYNWIVYGGTQIKKAVSVPVIVVNEIKKAEQAKFIIEEGLADFVAIGKSLLVDPAWANKALAGEAIDKCFNCPNCSWFSRDRAKVCPGEKAKR